MLGRIGRRSFVAVLLGVALLTCGGLAMAQDQGGQGRDRGQDRGDRGPRDPAAFRERMLNNLREQLGATDEEWQVLSPKIEKVMNAQREARFAGMGFGFGRRGGGMGGPDSQSVVGRAAAELRELLQNPDVTPDAINAKLAALREARAKAQADLAAAQKELKELLTPRQEATLVLFGMLE